MRAVISWDVDRTDPDFERILIAIVDCFPAKKLEPLTNQAALVNGIETVDFVDINERLQDVAAEYAGRLFYVFSLHSVNDPIYGTFRPTPGATVVAVGGPDD